MSGLVRRVKRNKWRVNSISGFKGGRNLNKIMATRDTESWPTKARRYVRDTIRAAQLRLKFRGRAAPPAGMSEAP